MDASKVSALHYRSVRNLQGQLFWRRKAVCVYSTKTITMKTTSKEHILSHCKPLFKNLIILNLASLYTGISGGYKISKNEGTVIIVPKT